MPGSQRAARTRSRTLFKKGLALGLWSRPLNEANYGLQARNTGNGRARFFPKAPCSWMILIALAWLPGCGGDSDRESPLNPVATLSQSEAAVADPGRATPQVETGEFQISAHEDGTVSITVLTNDNDIDGDSVSIDSFERPCSFFGIGSRL